jgi:hypothetical protein
VAKAKIKKRNPVRGEKKIKFQKNQRSGEKNWEGDEEKIK